MTTATRTRPPEALLDAPIEELLATIKRDAPAPTEAAEADESTRTKEVVIVAESGDLERTWATLILATSAAASGMKVSIFFTFWGLFPLVRPEVRVTGRNWMQKMLSVINRPGIDHLKLSRLNFAGMGPWMMKRLARQQGVALPGELLEMATAMGVRLIPCQMSLDMMGISPDQLVDGVEEPVGAAFALELMAHADATLFI
jgi:peroxiredoxin family protein